MSSTALIQPQLCAGGGYIEVECLGGASQVVGLGARAPLKLLCPKSRGQSVWVYAASFGGGLVAGDQLILDVAAGAGSRTLISTQSATKVYRSIDGKGCRQQCEVQVGPEALVAWLPDPVCCFADARYEQRQLFDLSDGASLVMLDWLTSGRRARGERWAFARYASRTDVLMESALAIRDTLLLDPEDGSIDAPHRMGRFDCLATLILLGPMVKEMAGRVIEQLGAEPVGKAAKLIASASRIRGGALVRVLGEGTQAVAEFLRPKLSGLASLLGDDPFARKW
jgi:urease accessory protein